LSAKAQKNKIKNAKLLSAPALEHEALISKLITEN
jgi:hypothetical protein